MIGSDPKHKRYHKRTNDYRHRKRVNPNIYKHNLDQEDEGYDSFPDNGKDFESEDDRKAPLKKCIEHREEVGKLFFNTVMHEQADEQTREETSRIAKEIHNSFSTNLTLIKKIEKLLKLIEHAKKHKVMFSAPYYNHIYLESTTIMDSLVRNSHVIDCLNGPYNYTKNEKYQLNLLSSKISDLVSTGIYMSEKALKFLPTDLLEKRHSYLLNLKQIVCGSIKKDEKKDVIENVLVEKDNGFYFVQCPEESVVTPAKFLSNPEFKDLEYGALQIGEGNDIIRIQNGQYCDMKGILQMTFPVGEEKIEMILSSENTSGFGKITVHMDDKNCEIFSKYLEELEKEPRISKVIEAASFVQNKAVSSPLSSMNDTDISNHLESIGQSASQNVG